MEFRIVFYGSKKLSLIIVDICTFMCNYMLVQNVMSVCNDQRS